ncbi:MAG: LrgB family protein [Bacteroidales bacterium]
MGGDLQSVWVYLETSPLLGLTATLLAYQAAHWIWRRGHMTPLLNPVLISIVLIAGFLMLTGIEYRTYFNGAQFVHFLLGPATVALAIPLYRQMRLLLRSATAVLVGLSAGAVTAAASAMGLAWLLGASERTIRSLAPKSATSPIAMAVSEGIGGLPSLTAVLAILTGITGSIIAVWVLDAVRVKNEAARGLAMGTAAHGIGTARAIQLGEVTGAFSGLAMGLTALVTTLVVPLLVRLFFG